MLQHAIRLAAVLALAIPALPAAAATPYVAAGVSVGGPSRLNGRILAGATDLGAFTADPKAEIAGEAAFGGYFGRRIAAEVNVRYGSANLREATIAGQLTPVNQGISTLTVLARGRFVVLPDAPVRPFIGGGIGVQRVDVGAADRTGFAYEALIGATVPIGRRWEIDGTLRYTGSTTAAFDAGAGITVSGLTYRTFAGGLTLRYRFGSAQ